MELFRASLPNLTANIRLFHAAPGAGPVDIYANGKQLATNLSFAHMTPYLNVTPGKYDIKIYRAGTKTNEVLSDTFEFLPNSVITLSAVLVESALSLFTLKDSTVSNITGSTFMRFINFSPTAPLLTLSLPSGDTLFNGVEYLETTGYYPLSPGIYDFLLEATDASALKLFIKSISLIENKYHTLYVIGLPDDKPRLGSFLSDDGIERKIPTQRFLNV